MGMALTAQADTYPRKVLVEHFTTIRCGNCPYGNNVLSLATKDRNTVWVAHHVGYYTDELTVDDSQQMLRFGIDGAPYAMIDRSVWENNGLKVGIGYTAAATGARIVGGYMDKASLVPANVGITISNNYNEESRDLSVTVSLERNADLPEGALLTVQIVEDDVYANTVQNGTTNGHIHDNVYRKSLTDILGDAIAWNGNSYSKTYTLNIPNEWVAANTRVVAFVNQTRNIYEPLKNSIYNAEQSATLIRSAEQAAAPEFTPAAGTYTDEVEVTISAAEGAEIRYTTDGSNPDENSTVYTAPFKITESTTVKAVAYQSDRTPSETVSAEYVIKHSGIQSIDTDEARNEAEWFDLQGRPVNPESLSPGIYVKRTGNTATRVAVK